MKLIYGIKICILLILMFSVNIQAENTKDKAIESIFEFQMKEKLKVPLDRIQDYINGDFDLRNRTLSKTENRILENEYEEVVSANFTIESELSAVINPTDSNNIIVSPIQQGGQLGLVCPVYYTKDFGATWQKSTFITSPDRVGAFVVGGGDPVLCFDGDGKAYFTWINLYVTVDSTQTPDSLFAGVFWAYSNDGGETWQESENKVIGDLISGNLLGTGFPPLFGDKQWVAADQSNSSYRNNLYTSVTAMKMVEELIDIKLYRKEAGSSEFITDGVDVSQGIGLAYQFSYLDVDKEGRVHVVFVAMRLEGTSYYHTVSEDGGKTFSQPVEISQLYGTEQNAGDMEQAVGLDRLFPCPAFAIDKTDGPNSGNLYFSWTANGISSNLGQGLDVYYSKSSDGGATWSDPIVLNDDAKDDNTHNYYSTLQVNDNGVLVATWYDRRQDDYNIEAHYYLTYSFDGGDSFMPNVPITSATSDFSVIGNSNNDFGIGEYNQTVMTEGYAIPFWADGRLNNGNINIYCAKVPISDIASSVESIKGTNSGFEIINIYPNPTNERANIKYTVESPSNMRLVLFDINARLSKEIFNEYTKEGIYERNIDLNNLPSGEYYLRLESDNAYEVQKLNIVR